MTKSDFKTCFDEFFDAIRNCIAYRCGDSELASDIAQEVFMKVWEKGVAFDLNKVKGLLYKIAHDLWVDNYRKKATAEKYCLQLTHKTSEENTPQEELQYLELQETYEKTLNLLPLKQREVFLMSRMEQLKYKEIAERLNISLKAVEKRMKLALLSMRKALDYENE